MYQVEFDSTKLRTFIYLSKTKVESLYGQVPQSVRTSKTVFGAGPAKLESTTSTPALSTEQQLMKVIDLLLAKDLVGVPTRPREYVLGTVDLRWGPYMDSFTGKESGMVFFGGWMDEVAIGLAGSDSHLLGSQGTASTHSHSMTPAILKELEPLVELSPLAARTASQSPKRQFTAEELLWATKAAVDQLDGVPSRCEFVARVLHADPDSDGIVLGTPLFVALD